MVRLQNSLLLPRSCARRVSRWAQQDYPVEACGLLLGRRRAGRVDVVDVVRMRNVEAARGHDRFALDPLEQLRAEERAIGLGLSVVGVWHSHPDCPARPSRRDLDAAWAGYSYLIQASAAEFPGELRSWLMASAGFVEQRVHVSDAD